MVRAIRALLLAARRGPVVHRATVNNTFSFQSLLDLYYYYILDR